MCVCWCGRSACTPPLLAGVRGVGVCVWARVSAAPRHSWLACWAVCLLVWALRLHPATPGWGARRGCVCLGSGFGCAPPLLAGVLGCVCARLCAPLVTCHSWLGCPVWVCVFGLGFRLRPATPGWGVGLCLCSCACPPCTPPLLAGVCGLGVCAWARVLAAPRHSWLGCWAVCVLVCALRLHPATPGWGARCGCVCLGLGFSCAPPLLAGLCIVGVCAWARVWAAPCHSWLRFVVCGLAIAWHPFMCRGSLRVVRALRVCGTWRPSLLGTCPCALVVADGVPLWRASWPRVVRRASSRLVALSAPVGFPVAVEPFPSPGGLRPRLYWAAARGTRRPAGNRALCACRWAPLRRGRWARSASYPFGAPRWGCPWRVPLALVLGCVRCGGLRVWTRSLTRPVPRTVCRSTGDSAGAPGLFRVNAHTAPCGSEDATPGSRACVRVLALLGRVGQAGLPGEFWCASPFPLAALAFSFACPLRAGVAPVSVLSFFFSVAVFRAPPLSPAFFGFRPRVPLALALCFVCLVGLALLGPPCARPPFVLPAWLLVVAWWLPPPPFLCLAVFPAAAAFLVFFFPCPRPRCLSLSLVSGPGCLGPWRCALRFFLLPPLGSPCALAFFFPAWPLAGPWCLVPPPPPPLCLAGFVAAARSPPPLLFLSLRAPPLSLAFSGFRPGCPGPWRCVLFALWASRFSALRVLSPSSVSRLTVGCSLVVSAPPPPCRLVLRSFFFALCAPVVSGFFWFQAPGALGLGPARCLPCWPPPSRLSVRSRLFRASRLGVGCSPVVAAPPSPPLCLAVFVASAWCCVPCVVLCCVSRVAVLRCAAARCAARCCAVVCCVVLLRSVSAAARRAVPSGAPRRPGALCFAALCFAVFPRAVCVLSLRGGVCCCSPLCFVLCVSWGAVLCVPCPLRSVRCFASLCWCACVVLFVWCVLLLVPGAVVRCRVLWRFLWCAVVRCWVWWPVVVCWCRAVEPCCPFSFAGGVGLCLFPVCTVLCCAARRVVRFRLIHRVRSVSVRHTCGYVDIETVQYSFVSHSITPDAYIFV